MYAGNRIGGSNPLASAIKIKKAFRSFFYFYLREDENRRFDRTTKRVKDKKLAFFFLSEEERKDFMK